MVNLKNGLDWVWGDPGPTLMVCLALFMLTAWLAGKYNHQSVPDKWLNTRKYVPLILGFGFLAAALDIKHGLPERLGIKAVQAVTYSVVVVLGDWFSLWLYSMANYHDPERMRTGWKGWMVDKPHEAVDKMKERVSKFRVSDKTKRIISLVGLIFGLLACLTIGSTSTPTAYIASPPQATAGALNSTYEARATASQEAAWIQSITGSPSSPDTLSAPMDTYTPIIYPPPSATQAPMPTPDTPVEVSPAPTGAGPQEVGEPLNCFPQPGAFCKEPGLFTARGGNRVRECASTACTYSRTLSAGEAVITGGYAQGNPGELWVCLEISEDDTPAHAQNCDGAIAWRFPDGYYGKYEVTK